MEAALDYQRQSNGWVTFLGHWCLLLVIIAAWLASQLLTFFTGLNGVRWLWCYGIGLAVAAVGVSLVSYAKIPLYQQRRFFTFGGRALSESRRSFYRWGNRSVFFAVALLLGLLLSRP